MKLFISASHKDRVFTDRFIETLEKEGFDILMDIAGIQGGTNWIEETQNSIESADLFVPLLSQHSMASAFRRAELLFALTLEKRILPVLIDGSPIPENLANHHVVDAKQEFSLFIKQFKSLLPLEAELRPALADTKDALEEQRQRLLDGAPQDRVFIAYSHHQRQIAEDLATTLMDAGKAVFYDAHIRVGARWRRAIQAALDDATHLVVIWTREASQSDEVEREVSYALAEGKYIIPLLSKEMPKLPYHLHGLHYIILEDDLTQIKGALLNAINERSETNNIWS